MGMTKTNAMTSATIRYGLLNIVSIDLPKEGGQYLAYMVNPVSHTSMVTHANANMVTSQEVSATNNHGGLQMYEPNMVAYHHCGTCLYRDMSLAWTSGCSCSAFLELTHICLL